MSDEVRQTTAFLYSLFMEKFAVLFGAFLVLIIFFFSFLNHHVLILIDVDGCLMGTFSMEEYVVTVSCELLTTLEPRN